MSAVLLIKLFAAPALIGLASLAGRRWGPNIAGLLGGLPLVGAPVVLTLWLSDGAEYAQQVSLTAPVGVWANIVYMLVVGYTSAFWRWYLAIPVGWACYLAAGLVIDAAGVAHSLWLGIGVIPALWIAATHWLPQPESIPHPAHLPRIELAARVAAAAALVLTLTTVSNAVGPSLTGILSGAPVAAVVIPAFTFANAGRDALLLALRGFLTGLMGFVVFFLVLAHTIPVMGLWAFMPSTLGGIATGFLAMRLAHSMRQRTAIA